MIEEENYGSVLKDCSKAIALNERSSKAYYRSALALLALERYEEALDVCNRCLAYDTGNASVQNARDRAQKAKDIRDKKELDRQDKLRREREEKRRLRVALEVRHVD